MGVRVPGAVSRYAQGVITPPLHVRLVLGYHPRETVVRVRPPALQEQRRRLLTQRSQTKLAMRTHADSTHPTIQPLRYTTPPGTLWRIVRGAQRLHTFANTARLIA